MSNKPKNVKSKVKVDTTKRIYTKPEWKGSDIFTINGLQLQEITNLASAFRPLVDVADTLIQSGELAGTIQVGYVYEDGGKVPKADPRLAGMVQAREVELDAMKSKVEEYQEKINSMMEEAKKAGGKTTEEMEDKDLKEVPTPKMEVVTDEGEKVKVKETETSS